MKIIITSEDYDLTSKQKEELFCVKKQIIPTQIFYHNKEKNITDPPKNKE